MTVLHKVTATEQLAYDATLIGLRHHFADRDVRWVHWTLRDRAPIANNCKLPIVGVRYYQFSGVVEVPLLQTTLLAHLECAVRMMEDGSREICSVHCVSPFLNEEALSLGMPQEYMSYWFGERRPRDRPKDALPKFLPKKFILLPRQRLLEDTV